MFCGLLLVPFCVFLRRGWKKKNFQKTHKKEGMGILKIRDGVHTYDKWDLENTKSYHSFPTL